jgi:hypothetical protein
VINIDATKARMFLSRNARENHTVFEETAYLSRPHDHAVDEDAAWHDMLGRDVASKSMESGFRRGPHRPSGTEEEQRAARRRPSD